MTNNELKANRRLLRIITLLAGREFDGLRPVDLQKALEKDGAKVSAATITRDLADMAEEGFAERVPGREEAWRLAPRAIQVFRSHTMGMERVRSRLEETERRYSRTI